MKKFVFIFSFLGIALLSTYAQEKDIIGIGWQKHGTDSLRHFSLLLEDNDKAFVKLTEIYGKPVKESAGKIVWENVSIEGIDFPVNVEIIDGFVSTPVKITTYKTFGTYEQKNEILSNLKEYESRLTKLTVLDESNANFIKTPELEQIIYNYLKKILAEL